MIEQIRCQQQKVDAGTRFEAESGRYSRWTSCVVYPCRRRLVTFIRKSWQRKECLRPPRCCIDEIIGMNIFNSVFVDCTASPDIAALYKDLLSHNVSVVAANKIAASSEYDIYAELKRIARQRGVKYLFETNVRSRSSGNQYHQ